MENKLTDNEIIEALGCCITNDCAKCKAYDETNGEIIDCLHAICRNALDLINRKNTEIDRLQKIIVGFMDEVGTWSNKYDVDISNIHKLPLLAKEDFNIKNKIKSEAIKEFAARVKQYRCIMGCGYDVVNVVDKLVKEMTE